MTNEKRPLKVFLCHAHSDKPKARELYRFLKRRGLQPWLDAEDLLPGQNWKVEIPRALETSDAIIILLSKTSVNKEGFVQKEIKFALDKALEMPEGRIFLIPARLEECEVPRSLGSYHWVDLFDEGGYDKLMRSLKLQAEELDRAKVDIQEPEDEKDYLKKLEGQAIRFELVGKFWDALQIYYEIKMRDPLFPRVDIKINELEKEFKLARWENVAIEYESKRDFPNALRAWQEIKKINPLFPQVDIKINQLERELRLAPIIKLWFSILGVAKKIYLLVREFRLTSAIKLGSGILVGVAIIFSVWGLSLLFTKTITQSPTPTFTIMPPSETPEPSLTPTEALTPITTPLYTEITDAKGVEMILIPAGIFTMGSDKGDVDEKPVHEVDLSAFYLDKYEVTNTLYKSCVDAGVCQHPTDTNSPTRSSYYGNPEFDDHPVMFVNWNMAKAYCEWRGARLPTEAEWEKAARGIDKRTYPWGEGISCSQANYRDCVGDTKVVGSFQDGASPYGAYDMAGNVWEWVQDRYLAEYYAISPGKSPSGPDSGTNHVVRGGAWDFPPEFVTTSDRFWGDPQGASNNFGFRCARDGNQAPGSTHVIIANRGWKTYIYAGVQLKSTINVSPGTDNSFRISFNLLKGEWVAVYKKLPPNALVDSQGLTISYEGTGKPNTLEVKLISTDDTVCKVVKHKLTNTNNSRIDLNIKYSELSCSSTGGNSMQLNLDNIDRIDLTFSNWPTDGDEAGTGDVSVHAIQSFPGP